MAREEKKENDILEKGQKKKNVARMIQTRELVGGMSVLYHCGSSAHVLCFGVISSLSYTRKKKKTDCKGACMEFRHNFILSYSRKNKT